MSYGGIGINDMFGKQANPSIGTFGTYNLLKNSIQNNKNQIASEMGGLQEVLGRTFNPLDDYLQNSIFGANSGEEITSLSPDAGNITFSATGDSYTASTGQAANQLKQMPDDESSLESVEVKNENKQEEFEVIEDKEGEDEYEIIGENQKKKFVGDEGKNVFNIDGKNNTVEIHNIGNDEEINLKGDKEDWEAIDTGKEDGGHFVLYKNEKTGTTVKLFSDEGGRDENWINDKVNFS